MPKCSNCSSQENMECVKSYGLGNEVPDLKKSNFTGAPFGRTGNPFLALAVTVLKAAASVEYRIYRCKQCGNEKKSLAVD